MPRTYRTIEGETLDSIAFRLFGDCNAVHDLIAMNPLAASLPELLPAGVILKIPNHDEKPEPKKTVRLWSQ